MNHFSEVASSVVDRHLLEQEELKNFLLSELETGASLEDICHINEIDLAKAKRSLASAGIGLAMLAAMGSPVAMAVKSTAEKETPAAIASSNMVMKRFNHAQRQTAKRQAIDSRREGRVSMANYNQDNPSVYLGGRPAGGTSDNSQADGKQTTKLSRSK